MLNVGNLKDLFGEESPEKVIARAQKLAARGKNDQALQAVRDGIAKLGEIPDLRLEESTLLLGLNRVREAGAAIRSLLKADGSSKSRVEEYIGWARTQFSNLEPIYEAVAEALIARRDLKTAVDYLERVDRKALEMSLTSRLANLTRFLEKGGAVPRSSVNILYYASLVHEVLDDWKQAIEGYRKILTAVPTEFGHVDGRIQGLVARHYKVATLRLGYADMLEEAGHKDRSQEEYLKALELDPRCADIVKHHIESLIEANPDDPGLLWASVKTHLAAGNPREAVAVCERLVEGDNRLADVQALLESFAGSANESAESLLLLARVFVQTENPQRAVAALTSAMSAGAGDKAIAGFERLLDKFPGEGRAYLSLAGYHLEAGRVDRCLDVLQALRKADPASAPTVASRLQSVLMAHPDNEKALGMLEEAALEAGDGQKAAPFLRRKLREGREAASQVLDRIRPLLASSPEEPSIKLAAAEASLAAGNHEQAWNFLQHLLDPASPSDTVVLRLVVLCAGSSREMCRKVGSFFSADAKNWSARPEIVFALAEASARAGEYREAVKRFRAAAKLAPESEQVCTEAIGGLAREFPAATADDAAALAVSLLDAGDAAGATRVIRSVESMPPAPAASLVDRFSEALRKDPGNLGLSSALAEVCLASGQVRRALEIAGKALAGRQEKESAPLALTYGEALVRSGRLAHATKAFSAAARRDPDLRGAVIGRLRHLVDLDGSHADARLCLGRLFALEGQVKEGSNELLSAWSLERKLGPAVLKDLEEMARKFPAEPALDFARAQILVASQEPARAAACLGDRLGHDPGLVDEVLARLEAIASRFVDCAVAHLELGRANYTKGWIERACACLGRALELDAGLAEPVLVLLGKMEKESPQVADVHLLRAALHHGQGRLLPAAESCARAVELGGEAGRQAAARLAQIPPETAQGQVGLLACRAARLRGDVERAVAAAGAALEAGAKMERVLEELDRLIEHAGSSSVVLLSRARVRLGMMRLADAAEDIDRALKAEPGCAVEAARLAGEICSRQPSFLPAVLLRAEALEMSGDTASARGFLDSRLESMTGGGEIDVILARRALARRSGEVEVASEMLRKAESAAGDRNAFLARLHRESIQDLADSPDDRARLLEAVRLCDYRLASEMLADRPPSALKAWVLQRAGRLAEAAACLRGMLEQPGAARAYEVIHDTVVAKDMDGSAEALMGETPLAFETDIVARDARPHHLGSAIAGEGGAE